MATKRDKNVLNMILNPMMPTEDAVDEDEKAGAHDEDEYSGLEGYAQSHELEIEGIRLSEAKNHEAAIEKFDEAIRSCPRNPSAFNNRAQERQLLKQVEAAKRDLDSAIELSGERGRAACQAFTQRGLIHRLQGDAEAARADYQKAAALGSKFAKLELVTLNPYAAMCNQMLHEVMQKLRNGTNQE